MSSHTKSPIRLALAALCWFALAGCGAEGTVDYEESSANPFSNANIWELQLPTGSGHHFDTVPPGNLPGFADAYYFKANDGGQIFMDPAHGITSSGSLHPRTELREVTASGGQVAWPASAINSLTVTGKVLEVGGGTSGHVTVGQIFNGSDSIPLFELMYSNAVGGFKGLYEEAKGGGGGLIDLRTPVALNTKYTFTLALEKNQLLVTINGKQVYSHTPSAKVLRKGFYFKAGAYDQTATAGAVSTTPYTEVENYIISVVHQ
jgi:hypothetical protein